MGFNRTDLQTSVITVLLGAVSAAAQTTSGAIQGTVLDPSGALIPSATVHLTNAFGLSKEIHSGSAGTFEFGRLVPGRYQLSVSADGFQLLQVSDAMVYAGKTTPETVVLQLPTEQQQVQVNDEGLALDTSSASNATAIVIKGKDLDAMSDDPDQLQDELNALAGPSAGPTGGQIYIDGFTGGQLPPKSSIREIRINQNPFSAQYDKLGYGRIEILTKPGTEKFHGSATINGNDSNFNSLNPFVTKEPPYYSTFLTGNASGALSKQSSWFASVFRRDNQSNSIVNAQLLDANGGTYNYSTAVSNPQSRLDISPRFDFQLGASNTLSIRYMYDRQKQTNSGVSQFALPEQAYNLTTQEHTLQVSDTQVLGPTIVTKSASSTQERAAIRLRKAPLRQSRFRVHLREGAITKELSGTTRIATSCRIT